MKFFSPILFLSILCIPLSAQENIMITSFEKGGYQIVGSVIKRQFPAQGDFSIKWDDSSTLSGDLSYQGNNSIVEGVYRNDTEMIEGIFSIWNSKSKRLSAKSDRALEWMPLSITHYQVDKRDWLVDLFIEQDHSHLVFSNQQDGSEIESIETEVSPETLVKYGYAAVDSLLCNSKYVQLDYVDGQTLAGEFSFRWGYYSPVPESVEIQGLPVKNVSSLSIHNKNEDSTRVKIFLIGDSLCEELEYNLASGVVCVEGNRIYQSIVSSSENVVGHINMSKERCFDGFFSIQQSGDNLSVTLGSGKLNYDSGESFVGNLGGVWKDDRPIDGTMYFIDGTSKQGDWLSGLKLNAFDNEELVKMSSPSEMRSAAEMMSANNKRVKSFSGRIPEGPSGYYYSGKPLETEEGSGKFEYYVEDGDRFYHGQYSFNLALYLTSNGTDKISVAGQYYNGNRVGSWRLLHRNGKNATVADIQESYAIDRLNGPFSYTLMLDGMRYIIEGHYLNGVLSGNVTIRMREGSNGFDVSGQFDGLGWADGEWSLTDRKSKENTTFYYDHGTLTRKTGNSKVSIKDIFMDPYEPLSQYKKTVNAFK